MNLNPDGEKGNEAESGACSLLSSQNRTICDIFGLNISDFQRSITGFFSFLSFNGSWDLLCSIRRACVFVYTVCVFVLHARERKERKPEQGGVEGLGGGFNSREADGAEGRRLMQHRAREGKKERQDLEQIGWMSGEKDGDNVTVVGSQRSSRAKGK